MQFYVLTGLMCILFSTTAWKPYSDVRDVLHENLMSIRDDLCQSLSGTSSQLYHHLEGSCREDFKVSLFIAKYFTTVCVVYTFRVFTTGTCS